MQLLYDRKITAHENKNPPYWCDTYFVCVKLVVEDSDYTGSAAKEEQTTIRDAGAARDLLLEAPVQQVDGGRVASVLNADDTIRVSPANDGRPQHIRRVDGSHTWRRQEQPDVTTVTTVKQFCYLFT